MMSDYSKFSIVLPAQPYMEKFLERHNKHIAEMDDYGKLEYGVGYTATVIEEGLWIKDADGRGNIEGASYLIRRYLHQYAGATNAVILEYAICGDNQFYGGAKIITKYKDIEFDPYEMALSVARREGWNVFAPVI
jgi:hypothetical protein